MHGMGNILPTSVTVDVQHFSRLLSAHHVQTSCQLEYRSTGTGSCAR